MFAGSVSLFACNGPLSACNGPLSALTMTLFANNDSSNACSEIYHGAQGTGPARPRTAASQPSTSTAYRSQFLRAV